MAVQVYPVYHIAMDILAKKFEFPCQITNDSISSFNFKTETFNAFLIAADTEVFPRESENF